MLSQKLIKKALALTDKTIKYIYELEELTPVDFEYMVSIPKFCYYLLSPEFVEKYAFIVYEWSDDEYKDKSSRTIGQAIYEYQLGNEESLTTLLFKI